LTHFDGASIGSGYGGEEAGEGEETHIELKDVLWRSISERRERKRKKQMRIHTFQRMNANESG
jgi:hypothetical protein